MKLPEISVHSSKKNIFPKLHNRFIFIYLCKIRKINKFKAPSHPYHFSSQFTCDLRRKKAENMSKKFVLYYKNKVHTKNPYFYCLCTIMHKEIFSSNIEENGKVNWCLLTKQNKTENITAKKNFCRTTRKSTIFIFCFDFLRQKRKKLILQVHKRTIIVRDLMSSDDGKSILKLELFARKFSNFLGFSIKQVHNA